MPVIPLPESTVRAIGSISVLNDACAVVKELLDNALDAQATTVTVEISANALDVIQVKDNGFGIGPDDRKLICKRSHTSKIETLEDLHCVGGTSLGFRGEALWSIVESSKAVFITTRTEGEIVGECLEYSRPEKLARSSKNSHPVGTTIRVQDFLQNVPVRRQTALKSPSKSLMNIRRLLQNYAFARPEIRLSLRVLNGKDPKINWAYAPKQDATMSDVAIQVIGQDLSARCSLKSLVSKQAPSKIGLNRCDSSQIANEVDEGVGISLDMLLPIQEGDYSQVVTGGQYISIDRRPLSSARGTPKEIVKLFKAYLQSTSRKSSNCHSLSNPFLCLHINCPRGSYDVNVEPAKDDVLFGEPQEVLRLAENIFRSAYGELDDQKRPQRSLKKTKNAESGFDLLLAHNPKITHESSRNSGSDDAQGQEFRYSAFQRYSPQASSSSMLRTGPIAEPQTTMKDEDENELRSANVTNPWSLARLHGKGQPRRSRDLQASPDNATRFDSVPTIASSAVLPQFHNSELPCPTKSPLRIIPGRDTAALQHSENRPLDLRGELLVNAEEGKAKSRPEVLGQASHRTARSNCSSAKALPCFQQPRQAFNGSGSGRFNPPGVFRHNKRQQRQQQDIESESGIDVNTEIASSPFQSQQSAQHSSPDHIVNSPFIPPSKAKSSSPAHIRSEAAFAHQYSPNTPPSRSQPLGSASAPHYHIDAKSNLLTPPFTSSQTRQPSLASLMDYEHRKKLLLTSQRQQGRQSTLPKISVRRDDASNVSETVDGIFGGNQLLSSPHENRYRAAKAALQPEKSSSASKLLETDPRAYLMRNQDGLNHQSRPGSKFRLKRLKTTLLPLEIIPANARLVRVNALLPRHASDLSNIRKANQILRKTDHYVLNGSLQVVSEQWARILDEAKLLARWNAKIRTLLEHKANVEQQTSLSLRDHLSDELEIDFQKLAKAVVSKN